jgi:plastocyanin
MRLFPLALAALLAAPGQATELLIEVGTAGAPVGEAVIELWPRAGTATAMAARDAVMDQVDSQFAPHVLLVPRGSQVRFPNSDRIRHQVYSFSPVKRFELPLYTGTPPAPVRFETAGVVTLGCNIHDWMKGYIVVTDAPHAGLSDARGQLRLVLPAGDYTLQVWHERLPAPRPPERLRVPEAAVHRHPVALALAEPPPPRGTDRLRALQERFRTQKREP